jgi:hypothetical protein
LAEVGLLRSKSAATYRRNDRNLRSCRYGARKSARKSNILFPDENIDMFPDLSLLCRHAISKTWVEYPQSRQRVCQGSGRVCYVDFAVPLSEFAQRPRYVKRHWHDHFFVRRDLFVTSDFDRDVTVDDTALVKAEL